MENRWLQTGTFPDCSRKSGKNVLKTYYFLLAAASFRAREDSWQIELEHCAAVPTKTVKLSDDELQEIFRSGDQTRLMETVNNVGDHGRTRHKNRAISESLVWNIDGCNCRRLWNLDICCGKFR